METRKIKISDIEMNDDRAEGGKGDIDSLARNLEKYGQINAVTVVKADFESEYIYRVIAGRRRITAAKSLGWEEIRADVYDFDEIDSESEEMIALSENAAREEMNAIDEGILYANELKKGTSVDELTALFCRNKKTVYQRAKLAQLIPEMRELYKAEKFPLHIAAMAADLPEKAQKQCVEKCKDRTWGTLSEWEVKAIVSEVSEDYVNKLGDCKSCENCPKRTRYSDKTLFPELAETCDRCYDHECFLKNLKAYIENEYKVFKKNNKENFRILTAEELPENLNLDITISVLDENERDITDLAPDEFDIKEKLKSLGKIEYVAFWNGTRFELRDIAKEKDIEEFCSDNGYKEKKEPTEWEKKQIEEIKEVFTNFSDEIKNPILKNTYDWWQSKQKIENIFDEKLKSAVTKENKNLEKEQLALIILLHSSIEDLKEFIPDLDKDAKLYSYSLYEKLLKSDCEFLIRVILGSLFNRYIKKPGILETNGSDWSKIFSHIDINLNKIRDNSVKEVLGIESAEENEQDSEEFFDEDIEKFGEISDDIED
jgi:ParB/RepB/Spo0J family partition protein